MISRQDNVPIFTREIIAYLAGFLSIVELERLAATCKLAYRHVNSHWDSILKSPRITLMLLAQFNAKLLSRFLDRFFWDNKAREDRLIDKIAKELNNDEAHALYALFAPRDHLTLNVVAIQQSVKFLLANGFDMKSALMRSLNLVVIISSEQLDRRFFSQQDTNVHINLRGANLDNLDLDQIFLAYANLSDTSCQSTNFNKTYLTCTNLRRSILDKANLDNTQMWKADLSYVSAKHATFYGSFLKKANLCNANFSFAGLCVRPSFHIADDKRILQHNETILSGCVYNSKTIFLNLFSKRKRKMIKAKESTHTHKPS